MRGSGARGRRALPPALRPPPALAFPVFLPRTPGRCQACLTPLPWATALPLRLATRLPPRPPPPLHPRPPQPQPRQNTPRTCQSPILASRDITAQRSWRRVPAGHGLEGSAGPAPWNRLGKSSFFYLLTNISPGHKELGCYLPTHARWPRNSLRQPQSQHLAELTWEVMDL